MIHIHHDSVSTVSLKFQAHPLFHISSLIVKILDWEQVDKFSGVLVEF